MGPRRNETRAKAVIDAVESGAFAVTDDDLRKPPAGRADVVSAYRFEYCGALRAFFNPYLRRSFSRASRVR